MLLYSWVRGLDVCVDLTGSSTLTQTGMADFVPDRAVIDETQRKHGKYEAKCTTIGYGFLPFSFSSFGELEKGAVTLLKRIWKFFMTQDIGVRAAVHIVNRIGRDTIQLDDVVSTISGEYLLEFTSEYGILEDWHPEFPGPEDTIVDFPEGKVEMDLFNLISAPNPTKVKTGTQPRAAHKVPLLTTTANRVIDMDTTRALGSSEKPSIDELSWEIPSVGHAMTTEVIPETGPEEEVSTIGPPVNKRQKQMRCKRANDEAEANAPPKVLRKDHVSSPEHSSYGGKSLAAMGLGAGSISSTPSAQGAPTAMSDPDPLSSSRGMTTEIPTKHVTTTEVNIQLSVGSPESGKLTFVPSVVVEKGQGQDSHMRSEDPSKGEDIKKLDQEVKSLRTTKMEVHGLRNQTKNLKTLLEAEADMKKTAESKNAELTNELEMSNLQAQITGEEKIKAAFKKFKKYEDDRVEQRCAEMDARLDKLSMDFNEELYPHMLTAMAGHR
ncbi:hypothetical protein Tco_0024108 [Tanacetum coccineum]